jgi:excisionase family DNA binding protein
MTQAKELGTMNGTISVDEAAQQGRYNPEWVRELIRQGKIAARKIGRVWFVDIKSFQDYLKQHNR